MFTIIENVTVEKPHYRLKKTGAKGRYLKGPMIFDSGTVDLFIVSECGVVATGFMVDGNIIIGCLSKDGVNYYPDYGNVVPDSLTELASYVNVEDAINKSKMSNGKEASLEITSVGLDIYYALRFINYTPNYGKLPRHVSDTDRSKYLGNLSKPIWSKKCQTSLHTQDLSAVS